MKLHYLLFFVLTAVGVSGHELKISINEIYYRRIPNVPVTTRLATERKPTTLLIDTQTLTTVEASTSLFVGVKSISKYGIAKRKLTYANQSLSSAVRILFQGRLPDTDIVIFQDSYASANPLYWPAALSGHPIQFAEVWLMLRHDDGKFVKTRLLDRSRAANWEAFVTAGTPAP